MRTAKPSNTFAMRARAPSRNTTSFYFHWRALWAHLEQAADRFKGCMHLLCLHVHMPRALSHTYGHTTPFVSSSPPSLSSLPFSDTTDKLVHTATHATPHCRDTVRKSETTRRLKMQEKLQMLKELLEESSDDSDSGSDNNDEDNTNNNNNNNNNSRSDKKKTKEKKTMHMKRKMQEMTHTEVLEKAIEKLKSQTKVLSLPSSSSVSLLSFSVFPLSYPYLFLLAPASLSFVRCSFE